ncbi:MULTISPECIES: hypothetical protein [Erwinia]|uniref:Uncharacterized protein n=1 Tax=Erwinia rhapontici TaxID=55212 RepID=A0ABN6DRJ3_ERWRD|nr:hypothetical protein [Erwinia rhapontici]BCQ37369.1 hypothetical protein ERHA53_47120 [Erwinia rhapontici]
MGRGNPVIINGKSFPSKTAAKNHFMNQRERVKADGPLKSGELYEDLLDLYMNYVALHPEHALNGRRITAFSVDFEPRENAGRWGSYLCYWVEFSATQKKPFSLPGAVDDIAAAQATAQQ